MDSVTHRKAHLKGWRSARLTTSKMALHKKRSNLMTEPVHLPDDILISSVLSKLPAKSLYRFKCVSKLWNATISGDPYFAKSHLSWARQISTSSILGIYRLSVDQNFFDYIFVKEDCTELFRFRTKTDTQLVTHCNGLYCFYSNPGLEICNPCTQDLLYHPLPELHKTTHVVYGFGFDALENKYKVVGLVHSSGKGYDRCMIYTFGTSGNNLWKDITTTSRLSTQLKCFTYPFSRSLYINGKIYWVFGEHIMFLEFDVHYEKFQCFDAPGPAIRLRENFHKTRDSDLFLMEWQGCVCLALSNSEGTMAHLYKYETHHDWKLLELSTVISRRDEADAEDVLHAPDEYIKIFTQKGKIGKFVYDSNSKTARCLVIPSRRYDSIQIDGRSATACNYVHHFENLVSLKMFV